MNHVCASHGPGCGLAGGPWRAPGDRREGLEEAPPGSRGISMPLDASRCPKEPKCLAASGRVQMPENGPTTVDDLDPAPRSSYSLL
eukprot:8355245-Pyramimonas_sp.AAC.1